MSSFSVAIDLDKVPQERSRTNEGILAGATNEPTPTRSRSQQSPTMTTQRQQRTHQKPLPNHQYHTFELRTTVPFLGGYFAMHMQHFTHCEYVDKAQFSSRLGSFAYFNGHVTIPWSMINATSSFSGTQITPVDVSSTPPVAATSDGMLPRYEMNYTQQLHYKSSITYAFALSIPQMHDLHCSSRVIHLASTETTGNMLPPQFAAQLANSFGAHLAANLGNLHLSSLAMLCVSFRRCCYRRSTQFTTTTVTTIRNEQCCAGARHKSTVFTIKRTV